MVFIWSIRMGSNRARIGRNRPRDLVFDTDSSSAVRKGKDDVASSLASLWGQSVSERKGARAASGFAVGSRCWAGLLCCDACVREKGRRREWARPMGLACEAVLSFLILFFFFSDLFKSGLKPTQIRSKHFQKILYKPFFESL